MNPLKQYKIGFVGLSNGVHEFIFDIGPEFFSGFDVPAFEEGSVQLTLTLEKSNTMLAFDFRFSGYAMLACDRCLEMYKHVFELQKQLLVKFGAQYMEQSDEVIVIPATESHFDISQYVYEFLHLGLPIRRVHPEGTDELPGCDPDIIRKLNMLAGKNQDKGEGGSEDSPWDPLKSITFN